MKSPMGAPRLLLVEFVGESPRRDRRAVFFPFYKGFAQSHGCRARWLCLGTLWRPDGRAPEPGTDDARRLERHFAAFAPTHALLNEVIAPRLRRRLAAAAPGCRWLTTMEHLGDQGAGLASAFELVGGRGSIPERMSLFYRTGWLAQWLGLRCGPPDYFVGTATPSYDAVMVNPQSRRFRPFLTIAGGIPCDYRADAGRNPYFRGVDLSACGRRTGCTFCVCSHEAMGPLDRDPVELARIQLAAVLRTAGAAGRNCGRFDVYDVRLFQRAADFFAMLFAMDFPATEFCFAPRIDHFLRAGADLERLLPELKARGHRLSLFRMGLEHFSRAENQRFNKGLTARQIDRGLALARRLRAAYPESFDYAHPFGYIAFTPWTTLEDVARSVREGIRRGFEPKSPWLYAALRLDGGTPLAALARREGGIIRRRFADPALVYASSLEGPLQPDILPWRFKDRRTAAAFAIIARLCALSLRGSMPDAALAGDPLYAWLARFAADHGLDPWRLDFAEELIKVMSAADPPSTRKGLVRRAWQRLACRTP
jgi:hypothetical protein